VVEAHRVEWTRLTIDTLSFASDHAAREALLCLTIDGLSLHDVGALARLPVRRAAVFVDESPPERRAELLGADSGRVLRFGGADGIFEVAYVVERTEPTLLDERVAQRARETALHESAQLAIRERVSSRRRR
jgi:hypothetical protein